jgi:riboflavin synthase
MFTGIVQHCGRVLALDHNPTGARLALDAVPGWSLSEGESIAVNGCCLTALPGAANPVFDLSQETLAKTSLGALRAGDRVNLERALRLGDALGGHLMAGHVDGLAELVAIRPEGEGAVWTLRAPADLAALIASKGSVALDGVSLTPIDVRGDEFSVALIPHTLQATQFSLRKPGDRLNLEADVLARYLQRQLEARR